MKAKIEEVINRGKNTIEEMKTEEEKKLETLKKRINALESKVKKKDEEIVEMKNLMKLKQTTFVESLQSLTTDFASKQKDLQDVILQKQQEIEEIEEKLRKNTVPDKTAASTDHKTSKNSSNSSNVKDDNSWNNSNSNDGGNHKTAPTACFKCGEEGHSSRQCNEILTNKMWCSHCSKNTHKTENCWYLKQKNQRKDSRKNNDPKKQSQRGPKPLQREKPSNDNEMNDTTDENKRPNRDAKDKNRKVGMKRVTCSICNKVGHQEGDCWHANESNDSRCTVCHKFGHVEKNCRHRNKKDTNRCAICRKFGHLEKDCWLNKERSVSMDNSDKDFSGHHTTTSSKHGKDTKCKICKKFGHLEGDCKKARTKDDNNITISTPSHQPSKSNENHEAPDITSSTNAPVPSKNQDMLMLCMKTLMDQWHQQKQN